MEKQAFRRNFEVVALHDDDFRFSECLPGASEYGHLKAVRVQFEQVWPGQLSGLDFVINRRRLDLNIVQLVWHVGGLTRKGIGGIEV